MWLKITYLTWGILNIVWLKNNVPHVWHIEYHAIKNNVSHVRHIEYHVIKNNVSQVWHIEYDVIKK